MDIVDDNKDKDNGRLGGTMKMMRMVAKEDEDSGQEGLLGSVGREEKPNIVGCLCGRRGVHIDKDNNNKGL